MNVVALQCRFANIDRFTVHILFRIVGPTYTDLLIFVDPETTIYRGFIFFNRNYVIQVDLF